MPKIENDDDLLRAVSEGDKLGSQIADLRELQVEHDSALSELDHKHQEMTQRLIEAAMELGRAGADLYAVATQRTMRTQALHRIRSEIKGALKSVRSLRRKVDSYIGQDVCPRCSSTDIAPILYGHFSVDPDREEPYVNGGSTWNPEKSVCCLDCGERFLGNFEKWTRARIDSTAPPTSS